MIRGVAEWRTAGAYNAFLRRINNRYYLTDATHRAEAEWNSLGVHRDQWSLLLDYFANFFCADTRLA
jgi:hypothetical protein